MPGRALTDTDNAIQCNVCGMLIHRCSLKRHLRVQHSTEEERESIKIYCQYPGCPNRTGFFDMNNYKTHYRQHTGEKLACADCPFQTTDPGSLTRHRARFHPNHPQYHTAYTREYSVDVRPGTRPWEL